ncbi:caspase family protein [Streptomyces sp. NRRL S-87]|uniref:caspase family protein n=1 Tax=Streptomyces sp. NRRL S-87 TaxID=1463920 RepID=UPI00131C4CF7|nr:caspase family protein [Streptomyces sp. NRRL S-87]
MKGLLNPPPSHTRVHDLFTHRRLPDWELTMCVVQVLAHRAHALDASVEGDRFNQLWLLADEELALDPLAGGTDRPPPRQEATRPPRQEATRPASPAYAAPETPRLVRASSPRSFLPDPDRCRAVLFGVRDYLHLPPLPSVPAGLRDLAAALTHPTAAFAAEHSQVLVDPRDATKVLDLVQEASDEATDTLLLYFSGHGLIDSESGELSLALPDSRPDAEYTRLQYNWIRRMLLRSGAQRKVVVLDCCYSGRAMNSMGDVDTVPLADIEGTVLLTSSSPNRVALAPAGEPYTAFTGELIDILRHGIPDGPPVLDIDSVYHELYRRAVAKARPLPQLQARGSMGLMPLAVNLRYRRAPLG